MITIMAAFLSLLAPALPASGLAGLAGLLGGAGDTGALFVRLESGHGEVQASGHTNPG
ncbi:hypothetical protein ACFXBB_34210 [Streptomyces scopuliridis]|uniref:hypothetical protein n=1 Tax=Streptomyces scopuliridis TaxID=452529 RepID=UPI0036CD6146